MLMRSENIENMTNSAVSVESVSLWTRIRSKTRHLAGVLLEKFHVPARIKEFEYVDPITNEIIYLSTGARYSVLHVGGTQYFFERLTGRFDGTCTLLEERIADGLELRD
jgi:hypothetical protein